MHLHMTVCVIVPIYVCISMYFPLVYIGAYVCDCVWLSVFVCGCVHVVRICAYIHCMFVCGCLSLRRFVHLHVVLCKFVHAFV